MNRKTELTALLLKALDSERGIIVKVFGDSPNKRQSALSALVALKRELQPDEPRLLDLRILLVPSSQDEIALQRIDFNPEGS